MGVRGMSSVFDRDLQFQLYFLVFRNVLHVLLFSCYNCIQEHEGWGGTLDRWSPAGVAPPSSAHAALMAS